MVDFCGYYYLNEADVVAIEKEQEGEEPGQVRYQVRVWMRDGRSYGVTYASEKARNNTAAMIAKQVEKATGKDERVLESIYNKLYLMEGQIRRADKRTLRIWQQLKAILGVEVEEDGHA